MNVNTIAKVHLRFKKHLFLYLCSFEILEHLHSRLLNLKTSPLTFFFKTWIQTNKTSNLPSIYHRKWFQQFFIRQNSGCVACGSQFPDQGSNPHPLCWKHGVLTTVHQRSPRTLSFKAKVSNAISRIKRLTMMLFQTNLNG